MSKNKKSIDSLIVMRYLKGIGSAEDIRIVKNWFSDAESEDDLYEKSLAYWDEISLEPELNKYSEANILDKIHHKIRIEEAELLTKPNVFKVIMRYAAIFIVTFSLSGSLFYYIGKNNVVRPDQRFSELAVPLGSSAQFSLPDGTAVRLNSGSRLKYDNRFGIKDRIVELEGEGYFKVAKDRTKIFTVKTSFLNVTALGTSFNVKAYSDDKTIETTLVEGSLKIEEMTNNGKAEIVVLKPNQKLIFFKEDSKLVDETATQKPGINNKIETLKEQESKSIPNLVTENVNVEPVISWTENRWIFEKKSLAQIAVELERKFDVQIIFASEKLKTFRFTGIIIAEPIDQVLEVMSLSAPISFKLKGRIVTLWENKKFEESSYQLYNKN